MSDRLLENARNITKYPMLYSDKEVIRAIRFLAQKGDIKALSDIIYFPTLFKKEYILEAIKASRKLETIDFFKFIFTWATLFGFTEDQISEAIDVAIYHDREDLLIMVMESPEKHSIKNRDKVSKYLYEGKERYELQNEQPEFRGKSPSALRNLIEKQKEDEVSKKKKILISYKTVDKWFADEVVFYLMEKHQHGFVILFDDFEIVPGDSLSSEINRMLEEYDRSIMVWTPEYFQGIGWAEIEKNAILNRRIREHKNFVPILLRGNRQMIPTIFKDYVPADFRDYEENRSQQIFDKKMKDVVKGLKK